MKTSELAERRRQIEESLQRNDKYRQNFIEKYQNFFNETSDISSNSLQESFTSSIKNDSDIFQQQSQKFNTIKENINNKQPKQQKIEIEVEVEIEIENSSGSISELIEEHYQSKYDKPLILDSSSDLEYSQSHNIQRKISNSILKKQLMSNSSGIEEFSFQNNVGFDNINIKTSNIFQNNNNNQNNNVAESQNNIQSILKQEKVFLNKNFSEDISNQNEQKNHYKNIYSLYKDSDFTQGSSRQIQMQLIEEERNSQQNFYNQQQKLPYHHQYQLSSSSSRKGEPSLFGNELVASSQQILQSKQLQNEKIPIYSYNSQGLQYSENINFLNFSNSVAQRQQNWQLNQSAFQQQQSNIGRNILNMPSLIENSYQSSAVLNSQQPASISNIDDSSSLRAYYPFNYSQINNNKSKDHEFFRLEREKREVEFPLDMKKKYEQIYEIQTSPNKNQATSLLRQPSPFQQYSQYQYEKQQDDLMRLKQIREQNHSYQNSERRENNFTNSQRSENSQQIINSQYKSPSRQEDSVKNMKGQFESQRNRFQQVLQNHVRKYSPHCRTSPQFKNTQDEIGNSKSFQITHLEDIYDSYRFNEDQSYSSSSSSSEESLQSSMGQSVKIQIQNALAKQKKNKQTTKCYKQQISHQKNQFEQKYNEQNSLLQQYMTNESEISHNSNTNFNNQMEGEMNQMKAQVFTQLQVANQKHEEENEQEDQQENQDNVRQDNNNQQKDNDENELEHQDSQNESEIKDNQKEDIQLYEEDEEQQHQIKSNKQLKQEDGEDLDNQRMDSFEQIQQQQFKTKKNQNKYPILQTIDHAFENDDIKQNRDQYSKNNNLQNFQNYASQDINPLKWERQKEQISNQSEKKQQIEEEKDQENILKQDEYEQEFQDQGQEEVNDDINNIINEQKDNNEDIEINENLILDLIEDLFQSITQEKDKENDEEKKHQCELLQIRLMDLMTQDRSQLCQSMREHQRNKQLESCVEELINIKKLFLQILISKQNKQIFCESYIDTLSPQEYQEDIQNQIKKLETLYFIQKKLINNRQSILQIHDQNEEELIQNLNKSREHNQYQDNQIHHEIFDRSRRNSTPKQSLIELNDFIKNLQQEYIQNEEEFMQRFNENFQLENQRQLSQLGKLQNHRNLPNDESQNNDNNKNYEYSKQNSKQLEDQIESQNEKITHNDLINQLDKKYNKRKSLQSEEIQQKVNDKDNHLDKSDKNVESGELENQLQQIRKNTQLKQDIQNMLKDKSDVFEKFKCRFEMKLNSQGKENDPRGKNSVLDDLDLNFQSEMRYEDSLKYSSLYREQAKKLQEQGKFVRQGSDGYSEKSAPSLMVEHTKNLGEEPYQNDKSELDKTLQEKVKHELFLENFRRNDILNSLNNRKIKDLIERYKHFRLSQQVMGLARGMKVMVNAKIQHKAKQDKVKHNIFNIIKQYSEYSQIKNNRRMQIEQTTQLKNIQIKAIAFQKIQKFCSQHIKWIEAIRENNKMMKLFKIISEWKKIINNKQMKRQADLYYKNTLFQKLKSKILERKTSVDIKAIVHYSNKLQYEYFKLFSQTTKEQRTKRIAINQKIKTNNQQLLTQTINQWRQYTQQKRQEKKDYIPIQICIKDTITKPKIQPNQTIKDYKRVPITAQKTITVTLQSETTFRS